MVRLVTVSALMFGIAVCSENRPDLFGHSHPNPDSTAMQESMDSPLQKQDPGPANLASSSGVCSDFHYHVSYDLTSVAPNLLGGHCRIAEYASVFCPVCWVHDAPPIAPSFEMDHPPLIG